MLIVVSLSCAFLTVFAPVPLSAYGAVWRRPYQKPAAQKSESEKKVDKIGYSVVASFASAWVMIKLRRIPYWIMPVVMSAVCYFAYNLQ